MGHYASFLTYNKLSSQLISDVEDIVSVVECVVGQWSYGGQAGYDRTKDLERNGFHRRGIDALMVVVIDLGTDSSSDTVLDHDTHLGAGNTGGLVPLV